MELLNDRQMPARVDFVDEKGREYTVPSSRLLEMARRDGEQFSYMMYVRIPRSVTRTAYANTSVDFVELPSHGESVRIYASRGKRGSAQRGELLSEMRVLSVISNYDVSKNTGIVLF